MKYLICNCLVIRKLFIKPTRMKTNLFTLALLLMSAGAMAQTKLADEWSAMLQARNTDVKAFFQARTTPDMTFIAGNDGSLQNKDWLMGLLKNQKSHHADLTNVKIQQVGDLAVVTGLSTLEAVLMDGKKLGPYTDAFTYTLRWLDGNGSTGQWMFTNFHHTKIEYK